MNTLKIEHLAPYLPYGLKVQFAEFDEMGNQTGGITELETLSLEHAGFKDSPDYYFDWEEDNPIIKPILRPLSDYQDINSERLGETNWDLNTQMEICDFALMKIGLHSLSYDAFICLIKDHADFFNLIEQGIAISTEEINPY